MSQTTVTLFLKLCIKLVFKNENSIIIYYSLVNFIVPS